MTHDDAIKILANELGWPSVTKEIGIRAKFCCEYCGKYLLSDVDTYDSWQIDHIVPNGDGDIDNLAVSCKTCNFIKSNTDPTETATNQDRQSLIIAAKELIIKKREVKETKLNRTVEAVNALST